MILAVVVRHVGRRAAHVEADQRALLAHRTHEHEHMMHTTLPSRQGRSKCAHTQPHRPPAPTESSGTCARVRDRNNHVIDAIIIRITA
jgi:hypothetical protein